MKIVRIPLSKVPPRYADSLLKYKNTSVDRWVDYLYEWGITTPIRVTHSGVLIEPPGLVEALRQMQSAGKQPPYGVTVEDGGEWTVPISIVNIPEAEMYDMCALAMAGGVDHAFSGGATDSSIIDVILAHDMPYVIAPAIGVATTDLELIREVLAKPDVEPEQEDYGIPQLDAALQGNVSDLALPVRWGRRKRTDVNPGMFHFYTSDEKFTRLISAPEDVPATGAAAAAECNFSLQTDSPTAIVLYKTYQKRTIARAWQSTGMRVFVDMNVPAAHIATNLIGVPAGWTAYINRAYATNPSHLTLAYNAARAHAEGAEIIYVVYGGGKSISALSAERGWHWIAEESNEVRGRHYEVVPEHG